MSLTKRCSSCESAQNVITNLENKIYWNLFIRFLMESYIMITLSCMINTKHIVWYSLVTIFNSILVIMTLLFVILYPVGMAMILDRHFRQLDTKGLQAQYGTIYKGLDFRKGKIILTHIFFFYFRRFLLAIAVVYLSDSISYQNVVMFLTTQMQIMLLAGSKVYRFPERNKAEALNEDAVLLCLYSTFMFTDYIPDASVKFAIGYFFSGLIISQLIINVVALFVKDIKRCKRGFKLKRHLKKQKLDIQKRKQKSKGASQNYVNLHKIGHDQQKRKSEPNMLQSPRYINKKQLANIVNTSQICYLKSKKKNQRVPNLSCILEESRVDKSSMGFQSSFNSPHRKITKEVKLERNEERLITEDPNTALWSLSLSHQNLNKIFPEKVNNSDGSLDYFDELQEQKDFENFFPKQGQTQILDNKHVQYASKLIRPPTDFSTNVTRELHNNISTNVTRELHNNIPSR